MDNILSYPKSVCNAVCTNLDSASKGLKNIGLGFMSVDSCVAQLAYILFVGLVVSAGTYYLFSQREQSKITVKDRRSASWKIPLLLVFYVIMWCFLIGAAMSSNGNEFSKIAELASYRNMYLAIAHIAVIFAVAVSFWTIGCYFPKLLIGFVPALILLLLMSLKINASVPVVVIALVVCLVLSILYGLFIYWANSYKFSSSLSKASMLLAKNSPMIVSTLLVLTILNVIQILTIHILVGKLGASFEIALPLEFALVAFSHRVFCNFMSVFLSSKFYMDMRKEKDSLGSSFARAVSSSGDAIKASLAVSFLTFIKQVCRVIYESEMEKKPKDRNGLLMIAMLLIEMVISVMERALRDLSYIIMNYIGIYGGSFDSETSSQAANRISKHPGYQIYDMFRFRYCIIPVLLSLWLGILRLFGDHLRIGELLSSPATTIFGLSSDLLFSCIILIAGTSMIFYIVECLHSAVICVFYHEIDSDLAMKSSKPYYEVESSINTR